MKRTLQLTIILLTTISFSQSYTTVYNVNFSNNYGLSLIAHEIAAFRNSWDNHKKRQEAVAKAQAQLKIVKDNYKNTSNYPQKIIDGWHLVMATDNYNYCSPAKVFIENNKIKKFVINNWEKLTRPFKILTPIKNGKALITLDLETNTDTLEIYFMNDLAEPTIVDGPLSSGYISFWSDLSKAKSIKIWLDHFYCGELGKTFHQEPNCGEEGTITLEVKPGSYIFKGAGRGTIQWNGKVIAKENQCTNFVLNKTNKS